MASFAPLVLAALAAPIAAKLGSMEEADRKAYTNRKPVAQPEGVGAVSDPNMYEAMLKNAKQD
jgi:hypothetical protein